ncbi:hypothetical protein [Streptomyces sp. JW3]
MRTWQTPGAPGAPDTTPETRRPAGPAAATPHDAGRPAVAVLTSNPSDR